MGRTGTEIANSLLGKSGAEREALAWAALLNDEVPAYLLDKSRWPEIVVSGVDKNSDAHTLTVRMAPRPVEVGDETDPFLMPLWPDTADRYANRRSCILATQKLIDDRWNFSILKLPISPPPGFTIPGPDMEKTESWIAHNKIIQGILAGNQALMSGGKKAVVSGPGLNGEKVAIYSSPFSGTGGPRPSGYPPHYQPYSTIHAAKYSDYSHGIWLIDREGARLDGAPVADLMALFVDPVLYPLVSDQGMFTPEFPNTGISGTSKFAIDSEPAESAGIADPPLAYTRTPAGEVVFHPEAYQENSTAARKGLAIGGVLGGGLTLLLITFNPIGILLGTAAGAYVGYKAGPRAQNKLRAFEADHPRSG